MPHVIYAHSSTDVSDRVDTLQADDPFRVSGPSGPGYCNGDRPLVPCPIRSVATPHGWIVADALARGTKAGMRVQSSDAAIKPSICGGGLGLNIPGARDVCCAHPVAKARMWGDVKKAGASLALTDDACWQSNVPFVSYVHDQPISSDSLLSHSVRINLAS
jgi:hypothetical protein